MGTVFRYAHMISSWYCFADCSSGRIECSAHLVILYRPQQQKRRMLLLVSCIMPTTLDRSLQNTLLEQPENTPW